MYTYMTQKVESRKVDAETNLEVCNEANNALKVSIGNHSDEITEIRGYRANLENLIKQVDNSLIDITKKIDESAENIDDLKTKNEKYEKKTNDDDIVMMKFENSLKISQNRMVEFEKLLRTICSK